MSFQKNAEDIAALAMRNVNPALTNKYVSLIRFLAENPGAAAAIRGRLAPPIGSIEYVKRQARNFSDARKPSAPTPPSTIPDEMVSVILVSYFGISERDIEKTKREHMLSMGAENMVGNLLERYLAFVLEPKGWIWCSGSVVRAVDFIKPPIAQNGSWRLLQVKNRDNSENSSSSAIRIGTTIEKWFRTFSRRAGSNWDAFPDGALRKHLSEDSFKDFVRGYLRELTK